MESVPELQLNQENLTGEESVLSPAKELEYRDALAAANAKNADLTEKVTDLTEKVTVLTEDITDLHQQIAMYKKALYGQKSEKTETILENAVQLTMFDEAENEAEITVCNAEAGIEVAAYKRKPKRTHEEMLADLPVEEVIHSSEDKKCPVCKSEMETVGKEFVRDELVYIPSKLFVRKHYVEVTKCPECGSDASKDAELSDIAKVVFIKASAPNPLIPHSFCSPELLAHIVFEKYCQAVPLYRQEKEYKALCVDISRTTMANWIIYAAKVFAGPVWKSMKSELLKGDVIHADETVVQVLHEPGKKAKTDSRMWVYASLKSEKTGGRSNILFQYAPTRSGDNAVKFLGDYSGYLICDGYDGYNKLTKITRCGCFAHVRRKFVEALPSDKELLPTSKAAVGVEWCNTLFKLEREYEKLTPEEKQKIRQERSKPVLDGFFAWLETINPSGGTKLARAVQYAKNEKKYLYRFLENPDIPIDNNRAENAIRPFVVGRKNWLFSDSVKGAEASAMFYSLIASAAANGLNTEKYLVELFKSGSPVQSMPW